jgi:hypothetical protein
LGVNGAPSERSPHEQDRKIARLQDRKTARPQDGKTAGLSWFPEKDHPRLPRITSGADAFPATCQAWRKGAEKRERDAKAGGLVWFAQRIKAELSA